MSEPPYPNGVPWRVGELERRTNRLEAGESGTITGDIREDLAEIKGELKQVKRAFWSMTGVFAVFITILLEVRPM